MWKPASSSNPNPKPAIPETEKTLEKPVMTTSHTFSEPASPAAPRDALINSQEQATIGKSLVIKGEVSGSESLFIDGRVEGAINLAGHRVTVGRNGQVQANIYAKDVVILGKVKGNVNASDRADIRTEGSLAGDVTCQRISIEEGAYFKGGIDIRKPGMKDLNGSAKGEPAAEPNAAAANA